MIKVNTYRALESVYVQKKGTFTQGNEYIGKVDNGVALLSNEGQWVGMYSNSNLRIIPNEGTFNKYFELVDTRYFKNKKELNTYTNEVKTQLKPLDRPLKYGEYVDYRHGGLVGK